MELSYDQEAVTVILDVELATPLEFQLRSIIEMAFSLTKMANWEASITKSSPGNDVMQNFTNYFYYYFNVSEHALAYASSHVYFHLLQLKCVLYLYHNVSASAQAVRWGEKDGSMDPGSLMEFSQCWAPLLSRFWDLYKGKWIPIQFGMLLILFLLLMPRGMILLMYPFNFGWIKNGIQLSW